MTRHVYFDTRDSDCERFLSAPIWDETCGTPLSVMSAFARLGLEPWGEADRLKGLTRNGAAAALETTLSRLPIIGADRPDYALIAKRLVDLLPERGGGGAIQDARQSVRARAGWWWIAAGAGVIFALQVNGYLF